MAEIGCGVSHGEGLRCGFDVECVGLPLFDHVGDCIVVDVVVERFDGLDERGEEDWLTRNQYHCLIDIDLICYGCYYERHCCMCEKWSGSHGCAGCCDRNCGDYCRSDESVVFDRLRGVDQLGQTEKQCHCQAHFRSFECVMLTGLG
jgi:hypothetical protein